MDLNLFTKAKAPGLVIAVVKSGKVIEKKGYGYADLKHKFRIDSKTQFRLASLSKAFTAASVLLLEQEGKLTEEDRVGKLFPEFPRHLRKIRIKHLIHHTAGLPDYGCICDAPEYSKNKISNGQILGWIKNIPKLDFEIGSRFEYSNTSYILLASLVERATSLPFFEFIQQRIFNPLEMKSSLYFSEKTKNKITRRAFGYGPWPLFKLDDWNVCNTAYGDDGIYTTAEDYTKWVVGLQSGKLFKPEFQKKIFSPTKLNDGQPNPYGYGWGIGGTTKEPLYGHFGAWVGFNTLVRYLVKKDIWIIIFSNYKDLPINEIAQSLVEKFGK